MFIFPSESVSASALHMKYNKQHIRDVCVSREWEGFYLSYLYKFLSVKFIWQPNSISNKFELGINLYILNFGKI